MKFLYERNLPLLSEINKIKRHNLKEVNLALFNKTFVKSNSEIASLDKEVEESSLTNTQKAEKLANLLTGDVYFNFDKNCFCASKMGFISILGSNVIIEPIFFVSDDSMAVYIILVPSFYPLVDYDFLKKQLEDLKCPYINYEYLDKLIKEQRNGIFIIAKGKYPQDGNCEKIIPLFDDKLTPGKIDDKGNIDFFERNFLRSFKQGDTIGKIIPAKPNEDGYDIFGKVLPSSFDNDPLFEIGTNVEKVEGFIVASSDGVLSITGKTINIHNLVKIDGDASVYTGNIRTTSSVYISGNILENITVEIDGDLIVMGTIAAPSKLLVKGNLFCVGGILGKKDSSYICEGSLQSRYLRNTNIYIKGDCIIEDDIINSTLFVNRNIICYSRKGIIVSSIIHCNKDIIAKYLGNDRGSANKIYMGHSYLAEQNLLAIRKLIMDTQRIEDEKIREFKLNLLSKYEKNIMEKLYNLKSHIFAINFIYADNIIVGPLAEHKISQDYAKVTVYYKPGPAISIAELPAKILDRIESIIKSIKFLEKVEQQFKGTDISEKKSKST